MTLYHQTADIWPLDHKVIFDGENKHIIINPSEHVISVKTDLYSDWKEWTQLRDNAKFAQAFRVIGGDPIDVTQGIYAGDIYFLMNGWQVSCNHLVEIKGVLYHDDSGISPYTFSGSGGVEAVRSNLTQTVSTAGSGGSTAPTVTDIRTELDTNSTKLARLDTTIGSIPGLVRSNLALELSRLDVAVGTRPDASTVASSVRVELAPELAKINTQVDGLTSNQLTMLLEIYQLYGLDPTKPLVITDTSRTTGTIAQNIQSTPSQTTVTRI